MGQVIGLETPEGSDWALVHGQQYALLKERVKVRVAMHLVGFVLIAATLYGSVPSTLLASWGIALVAAVVYSARADIQLADADSRNISTQEMKAHARTTAAKGVVWAVGMVACAFLADGHTTDIVWAVAAMLILATTASRFSAPLSSITFTLAAGIGGLVASLITFQFSLAVVVILSTLLASFGVIESARVAVAARLAESAMQEKSEVVSMLLREFEEGQADWLWQIDTRRRLHAVSPRFAFALGKEPAQIEGQSFLQLISGNGWKTGQFPPSLHELADKLKRKENFSNLSVKVSIEGQDRWWELSGTPIVDDLGTYQGFRGVGSDVTEQRESSEKIEYLARYDTLTQLPNRRMLNEALGEALGYAAEWRSRCAFLMIDLDRFKAINDSLGHLVGDQMLAEVALRLKGLIQDGEVCGRLGGDEFAVVIRDASERGRIERLSRAIIQRLSEPYEIENQVLYVGASVGSALGPRDGRTVEELLRNADLALYRAKDDGGGVHCEYEPSLHANAEEKRQLEHSLRNALEKNELLLHYQPVVDANSEEIVSFEALIRWNSEEHGFVSPGKFIPLAEDTRLIVPIGTWVMQEACREAATHWPEDVKVNVNVSPEQLLEPDFAATVVRALSHSGLDPKRLEIEVTESIFVRDAGIARKALEQCMALGCSIALDDFGTGYSSLGYLRQMKFSTIKVDRLFVQGAAQQSPESIAIIRAVVAMAESLDMTTTAEGVENDEEAKMIREFGCTKIQGFHFGRPMPSKDARRIFARKTAEASLKSA
ncbi:putative bifunctional diguanylate cyclase/phosphodiesterase [Qipengyuania flava]|uniref:putative bifunctional diguanylate cyclase/phosphodiesterase n=1 Tax=Qipengyuania flava TaxID=192812 RepID=UPI001C62F559|nr:EAL domain-containing protein [Qipengyuania flava]